MPQSQQTREQIIKSFPKNFKTTLADPYFAKLTAKDPTLLRECLLTFQSDLTEDCESKPFLIQDTGHLAAFLEFLQTKIGAKEIDLTITELFEEKIQEAQEGKKSNFVGLGTLLALFLAKNPTTDLNLLKRIKLAYISVSSKKQNLKDLNEKIEEREKRGY